MKRLLIGLSIFICLLIAEGGVLHASDAQVYQCATSEDVYKALTLSGSFWNVSRIEITGMKVTTTSSKE